MASQANHRNSEEHNRIRLRHRKAITSTIDYLKTKKIIIKVQHVKGHQDKKRKKEKLSTEAQMNIQADTEATIALEQHSHTQENNPLPETRAMLYKQGQTVTSKAMTSLLESRSAPTHDTTGKMEK